jgi:tellurite resistance protein
VGELWLGAAMALLMVSLALYARRVAQRPTSLLHDLRMPATRGAVSAASMGLMLSGAALAPLAATPAAAAWLLGVAAQLSLALLLLRELAAMPADARPATATLLVPFAGILVAPIGGVGLGFAEVATMLYLLGLIAWLILLPLILRQLWRGASPPPPVRPGTAILLAPPGVVAVGLEAIDPGHPGVPWLLGLGALTLLALLAKGRWLAGHGWFPSWAAFTFPLAALAGATLIMAARSQTMPWRMAAALALTAASLMTLYVASRLLKAWITGKPPLP